MNDRAFPQMTYEMAQQFAPAPAPSPAPREMVGVGAGLPGAPIASMPATSALTPTLPTLSAAIIGTLTQNDTPIAEPGFPGLRPYLSSIGMLNAYLDAAVPLFHILNADCIAANVTAVTVFKAFQRCLSDIAARVHPIVTLPESIAQYILAVGPRIVPNSPTTMTAAQASTLANDMLIFAQQYMSAKAGAAAQLTDAALFTQATHAANQSLGTNAVPLTVFFKGLGVPAKAIPQLVVAYQSFHTDAGVTGVTPNDVAMKGYAPVLLELIQGDAAISQNGYLDQTIGASLAFNTGVSSVVATRLADDLLFFLTLYLAAQTHQVEFQAHAAHPPPHPPPHITPPRIRPVDPNTGAPINLGPISTGGPVTASGALSVDPSANQMNAAAAAALQAALMQSAATTAPAAAAPATDNTAAWIAAGAVGVAAVGGIAYFAMRSPAGGAMEEYRANPLKRRRRKSRR